MFFKPVNLSAKICLQTFVFQKFLPDEDEVSNADNARVRFEPLIKGCVRSLIDRISQPVDKPRTTMTNCVVYVKRNCFRLTLGVFVKSEVCVATHHNKILNIKTRYSMIPVKKWTCSGCKWLLGLIWFLKIFWNTCWTRGVVVAFWSMMNSVIPLLDFGPTVL